MERARWKLLQDQRRDRKVVSSLPVEEIVEEIGSEKLPEKLSAKKTRKKGKRVIKR